MPYAEDPALYLADFGVACVGPGAVAFTALLNQPDELVQLADVGGISRSFELVYPSAAITLTRGAAVTVAGVAYSVREAPRQLSDGLFTSAMLTKV